MLRQGRESIIKTSVMMLTSAIFIWMASRSPIQGQILGVVFFALVIWSLYPNRHLESSVLIILLLTYFQASLSVDEFISSLFATYGGSGLWIIIAGFVLAKTMESSGLARRIALWIATSLSGNPNNIILSVAIANLAVSPLSPSTTAKAFLLLPVCTAIVEAFNIKKGESNYGTAVMLMAMAANNICSTAFLTATVPNPISAGYLKDLAGIELNWSQWFIMAFPLSTLLLLAAWLICIKMFPPEVRNTAEFLGKIREIRENLGPLTRREKIVALFFTTSLVLWITDNMHNYNSGLISLALSLILFIPKLGVIKSEKFTGEVPWGSIALFAASMFLAKAVGNYNALDPLAGTFFNLLNLSYYEPMIFIVLIVTVAMFMHVVFTSTTVYATVMLPLVISLSQLQGVAVEQVALPVAFLTPVAVILTVNTIPNLVFYGAGCFNQKQIFKYGLVLSLISIFLVLLIGVPYWKMTGFL